MTSWVLRADDEMRDEVRVLVRGGADVEGLPLSACAETGFVGMTGMVVVGQESDAESYPSGFPLSRE